MVVKKKAVKSDKFKQLSLLDEQGIFETLMPIASDRNSNYPTVFSLVPLFAAGDRDNYTTDQEHGRVYELPEGRIRRIGAGLDLYDEDTLIAILQLGAEKKVVGPRESMPLALSPGEVDKETTVYKGVLTAGRINDFLGRKDGGADLERTRDSIRRLANQRLWFETNSKDGMESVTDFFKYTGRKDLRGELLIQISPEMVTILQSYHIIDMRIRRKLNDCGKAVHRFLTPQLREYSISLEHLAEAICHDAGATSLKRSLLGRPASLKSKGRPNQLTLMKELGFLKEASITGTGKKKPFVLHVVKTEGRTGGSYIEESHRERIMNQNTSET
ncbi:MAG: hypothetical protein KUG76_08320 [Gammaproteobacteria bacterium]|nr:hypothetical protein [Gammaproteobacteria bacterium]